MLPQRFQHYAYYFRQDVKFKDAWYKGHEGVYERWVELNKQAEQADIGAVWPVSDLITGAWGKTDTVIRKVR